MIVQKIQHHKTLADLASFTIFRLSKTLDHPILRELNYENIWQVFEEIKKA
jgi:hypothetical protein